MPLFSKKTKGQSVTMAFFVYFIMKEVFYSFVMVIFLNFCVSVGAGATFKEGRIGSLSIINNRSMQICSLELYQPIVFNIDR